MSDRHEYRLKIDAFGVASLAMARLAEHMSELARLLGEQEHVHFSHLESGSAVLVANIEDPAVLKVGERLQAKRRSLDGAMFQELRVGPHRSDGRHLVDGDVCRGLVTEHRQERNGRIVATDPIARSRTSLGNHVQPARRRR